MKARKNPTNEQLLQRLRRAPDSDRNPRIKNDAYWALRHQGYPHSYAKRAFRDQKPIAHERPIIADNIEGDPEDLLFFAPGSTLAAVEVAVRPLLCEETIGGLEPRDSEYTVWDDKVRGFGVRVRQSGHKTYIVNYRICFYKRLHKYTIGLVTDFSLEEARDVARQFRCDARMGVDPKAILRDRAGCADLHSS